MRRSQIDSNTMRSSGVKIAGTHMYDWLILILLVVAGALLHLVSPFYRFVGKDMMTNLKCPLKRNTVPFLGCSGVIVAIFSYLQFFPPLYHAQGWGPHAYFEEMTSCTSAEAANTVGLPNSQALETPRERCLDERGNTDCIGLSLSPFSGRSPQDMESGER